MAVWLKSGGKKEGISLLKETFGDDHDPLINVQIITVR
jgi:hypothetical protein